jgi:hypothetical protein
MIWGKRIQLKTVLRGIVPFLAAQGCAAIWYSISVRIIPGVQNRIVPGWYKVFLSNISGLPREILSSTQPTQYVFAVGFIAWLLIVCATYMRALSDRQSKISALLNLTCLAACLSGALLSILAFSLGGRPMTGLGVDARAFLLVNAWCVVAVGMASAYCCREQRCGTALSCALLVSALALTVAHISRAQEWAKGWQIQQEILAETPIPDIKKMDSNAGVLLVKPLNFRGVPTFSASWDIQAAMWLTYPVTKGRQFDVYSENSRLKPSNFGELPPD